ncbi:MAG: hypothetical protein JSS10_06395 [Verrucomicrobia bacterium]|nr:hypothetical protein [Verrucomicrobiota bacterium]
MPIEGSWNTVKALFLTQAHLEESDRLNTFANESLWYVQYFLGREIIEQKEDAFYLVQKTETAGSASWISSSLKTAAYFLSGLIWVIPGTIARLLSIDSEEVRAAVLADRITQPPPKAPQVPRPRPAPPGPPSAPPLATPASAPAPQHVSLPHAVRKTFQVDPAARATNNINHHRIFNELESSFVFFRAFNALKGDSKQIKTWLEAQQQLRSYQQPFLFGFNLEAALGQHREKIRLIIPPINLECWEEAFTKARAKLKELGLTADEVEFLAEEKQPPQEKKSKGFIGSLKSIFSSEKPAESSEMNALADYIIDFYKELISLQSSRAEWLQKEGMDIGYFSPFFNTLYLQVSNPSRLNPQKLRLLILFHRKCIEILYREGLEHYLTEMPHNLSLGLCALVHCLSQDLIQCPESLRNITRALHVPSDRKDKELLMRGIEPIIYLPGMQAILTTPHHFEQNKYKFLWFLEMMWAGYVITLNEFLAITSRQNEVLQWMKAKETQKMVLPFSTVFKDLSDILRPILGDLLYESWNDVYAKSVKKLRSINLSFLVKKPILAQDSKAEEIAFAQKFLPLCTHFFKRLLVIPQNESEVWLAREASKLGYVYPFFHSLDLKCKMERLKTHLDPNAVSEWEALYLQACSKLKDLSLTQYLEEIPPRYFEKMIEIMTANTINQLLKNEPQPTPPPLITSTKGMPRKPNSIK